MRAGGGRRNQESLENFAAGHQARGGTSIERCHCNSGYARLHACAAVDLIQRWLRRSGGRKRPIRTPVACTLETGAEAGPELLARRSLPALSRTQRCRNRRRPNRARWEYSHAIARRSSLCCSSVMMAAKLGSMDTRVCPVDRSPTSSSLTLRSDGSAATFLHPDARDPFFLDHFGRWKNMAAPRPSIPSRKPARSSSFASIREPREDDDRSRTTRREWPALRALGIAHWWRQLEHPSSRCPPIPFPGPQPAPKPLRIRADAPTKTYRIEKQEDGQWRSVASFLVALGECKPEPPEVKEPPPPAPEPEPPAPAKHRKRRQV